MTFWGITLKTPPLWTIKTHSWNSLNWCEAVQRSTDKCHVEHVTLYFNLSNKCIMFLDTYREFSVWSDCYITNRKPHLICRESFGSHIFFKCFCIQKKCHRSNVSLSLACCQPRNIFVLIRCFLLWINIQGWKELWCSIAYD